MSFAVSAFRIYSHEHTLGEGQRRVVGLTERQSLSRTDRGIGITVDGISPINAVTTVRHLLKQ